MFYKKRKKLKRENRVRIDLTSSRYNLLKKKTNALIKRREIESTV